MRQGEQDTFPAHPPDIRLRPGRAGGGAIVLLNVETGERRLVMFGSQEAETLKREQRAAGRPLWFQDTTPGATSA